MNEFSVDRKISTLREGAFLKHLLYVSSSRLVGVMIGLILTPVIARIYSPETYGVYSFFAVLVNNLALISTLRYPTAFFVAKDQDELRGMMRGSFFILLGFSLLLTGLALSGFLFSGWIEQALHVPASLLLLVPAGVFLQGLLQVVSNKNVIDKEFKKAPPIGVFSNVLNKVSNILYGLYINVSFFGLVFGDLIGKLFNLFLRWVVIHKGRVSKIFHLKGIRSDLKVLKAYKDYPTQLLPSAWINLLGTQMPVFFLGYFFLAGDLGAYTMTVGLMNIPLQFFSNSLSPVFSQRASELKLRSRSALSHFFSSFYWNLTLLLLLPFSILSVWGDLIVEILLGEGWERSGEIIPSLSVLFFFRSLSQSFNKIYPILRKQKITLWLNLVRCIVFAIVLVVGGWWFSDYSFTINMYVIASVALYVLSFYIIFRLVHVPTGWLVLSIILFFVAVSLNYILRYYSIGFASI